MEANSERPSLAVRPSSPSGGATRALAALGLVDAGVSWQAVLSRSRMAGVVAGLRRGFQQRMAPLIETSVLVPAAPWLSLLTACLLLLVSPYVGTGLNAVLVLLAFGTLLFQWLVTPEGESTADGLDWPFLALLAISVVAVGFSPYLVLSVKGLAKMLIFWMSFFSFRSVLGRGERGWTPLFAALFTAGLVESLYGIYQWKIHVAPLALWDDAEAEVQLTRVYGSLKNPNLLSGYLIPIIPFAVAASITWRNLALRALAVATALTAPICLYFTYSRGAYLGIVGEAAVFGVLGLSAAWPTIRRSPKIMIGLGVALLAFVAAAAFAYHHSPAMQERLASIFATRTHSSNSFRLNVWHAVKRMIRDSWWAGIGLGNDTFRKVYALYMVSGFEALGAYNIFLEETVEKGVLGIAIFVWFVVASMGRALYHFARGVERAWATAAIAALLGLMIHGMVDTVFYRPSIQILFWLTLAVIIHLPRRSKVSA